jgi:hypothetical protein
MPSSVDQSCDTLACARAVRREFISLAPIANDPPSAVQIGVSPALMGMLTECNARAAFAEEIREMIASLSGARVRVELVQTTHLPRDGASLAVLRDAESRAQVNADVSAAHPLADLDSEPNPTPPERQEPIAATLELLCAGQRYAIGDALVIGRSSSCDIHVPDSEMSRRHAEVSSHDGGVVVRDLGSTNGTRVNGSMISAPTTVAAGDVIAAGTTEIRVVTA